MPEVEISAGPIDYGDSGGEGRPLVFIGGLPHDERLWDGVIAELAPQFRCLTPVLPLGAQRKALRPDADLSLPGMSADRHRVPRAARPLPTRSSASTTGAAPRR